MQGPLPNQTLAALPNLTMPRHNCMLYLLTNDWALPEGNASITIARNLKMTWNMSTKCKATKLSNTNNHALTSLMLRKQLGANLFTTWWLKNRIHTTYCTQSFISSKECQRARPERDRSHITTRTLTFYLIRNAFHGYKMLLFTFDHKTTFAFIICRNEWVQNLFG